MILCLFFHFWFEKFTGAIWICCFAASYLIEQMSLESWFQKMK